MPWGADWPIIDEGGRGRWVQGGGCFLTLVNQMNGPLGGRSGQPNHQGGGR